VFVERAGSKSLTTVRFQSEQQLRHVIAHMLILAPGKRIDASSPIVDISLPDGSRVNIALPPIVAGSAHITIRRYARTLRSLEDYVRSDAIDERMATFLFACVTARVNILLSGGAGAGKTTLMEVLTTYMAPMDRIVVLEDSLELHVTQPNVVRLLTRGPNGDGKGEVTLTDLFRASLRMRPTRILLGEIHGRETLEYLHAITSGHTGSVASIHAASPDEAVVRLQNMVAYSGYTVPAAVVRKQIAEGLHVVVQLEQIADGTRKVTRVAEIAGLTASGEVLVRDLFRYEAQGVGVNGRIAGHFVACDVVSALMRRFEVAGVVVDPAIFVNSSTGEPAWTS
jgi:pilus assembly protein CpaF